MRPRILMLSALLLATAAAWGEPAVRASVQDPAVTVGEPFGLQIEASGSRVGNPALPEVDGLRIDPTPASSRQQMTLTGSAMSWTQVWVFRVMALRSGKITIPPITVPVDGKEMKTSAIELNATQGQLTAPPVPSESAPPSNAGVPTSDRAPTMDDVVLTTAEVDKTTAYEGEPIQLTLTQWTLDYPNVQAGPYRNMTPAYPSTEGFYAAEFTPKQGKRERNGRPYQVLQLTQTLYPTHPGTLTIGSWHWEGQGFALTDRGRISKDYSLDTDPITITVKPLPDRPVAFSGAVGSFTVKAGFPEGGAAKQGVPVTMRVAISGQGNPDSVSAPKLPAIAGATVSMSENAPKTAEDAVLPEVNKSFNYMITPLQAGDLLIPAVEFCYFDPIAEAYKTETIGPYTVQVQASTEQSHAMVISDQTPIEAGQVSVIGKDILPNVNDPGPLRPYRPSFARTGAVALCPVLAYAGIAAFMARRRRFEQDKGYARAYFAKSKAHKRLHKVASAPEPAEELYHAVMGFVADKLNVSEAGLTSADLERLLTARSVDGELSSNLLKITRACERARYASVRLTPEETKALTRAAEVSLDQLEVLAVKEAAQ